MLLVDELIVCTKDRPEDLRRCLSSIALCSPFPGTVTIVDGSEDGSARNVVRDFKSSLPTKYLQTLPGLPFQRNQGVSASCADIVHFIDDDTIVEPEYFAAIMAVFHHRTDVIGVSGYITNLGDHHPTRLTRALHLDGDEGSLLASGLNVLVFTAGRDRRVQWLSGCSMSYRRHVLCHESFDERLRGYALGEDVELSTRVGRHGTLWHASAARLAHMESPYNRWADKRRCQVEIMNRHRRVWEQPELSTRAFWVSLVGQVLRFTTLAVVRRSRHSAHMAMWTASAGLRLLRGSM